MQQLEDSKKKVIVEKEKLFQNKDNTLLELEVKRDVDGISIKVKSEILERFFATGGRNREFNEWQGAYAYKIPPSLEINHRQMLGYWGHEFLIINGKPNLSFLTAEGISGGRVFKISQVCSRGEIIKYTKLMKQEVRSIFVSYMKPIKTGVTITVSTSGDTDEDE